MPALTFRSRLTPRGVEILDDLDRAAVTIINPDERAFHADRYLLTLGAYGWTRVIVYADSADSALDAAIDWCADHAPGLLADDTVAEECARAIAEGLPEDAAQERATADMTCGGNEGHYICGWEWTIDSGITRADIAAIVTR